MTFRGMLLLLITCLALPAAAEGDAAVTAALAAPDRLAADRERDARSRPDQVLPLLRLSRGDRVADIFGGAGYYSELLGRLVGPDGQVLLHNNAAYEAYVGEALEARFNGRSPTAVVRHRSEANDLALGQDSLDAAMIVMSYHDLYHVAPGWPQIDVEGFMGQVAAALKPGGRFLLVDHVAAPGSGSASAQDLHRIEPAFVVNDVERFGFRLAGSSDALRNPDDDYSVSAFDPAVRGRTDRFVMLFERLP
jgi:predicted methyltransferase